MSAQLKTLLFSLGSFLASAQHINMNAAAAHMAPREISASTTAMVLSIASASASSIATINPSKVSSQLYVTVTILNHNGTLATHHSLQIFYKGPNSSLSSLSVRSIPLSQRRLASQFLPVFKSRSSPPCRVQSLWNSWTPQQKRAWHPNSRLGTHPHGTARCQPTSSLGFSNSQTNCRQETLFTQSQQLRQLPRRTTALYRELPLAKRLHPKRPERTLVL